MPTANIYQRCLLSSSEHCFIVVLCNNNNNDNKSGSGDGGNRWWSMVFATFCRHLIDKQWPIGQKQSVDIFRVDRVGVANIHQIHQIHPIRPVNLLISSAAGKVQLFPISYLIICSQAFPSSDLFDCLNCYSFIAIVKLAKNALSLPSFMLNRVSHFLLLLQLHIGAAKKVV